LGWIEGGTEVQDRSEVLQGVLVCVGGQSVVCVLKLPGCEAELEPIRVNFSHHVGQTLQGYNAPEVNVGQTLQGYNALDVHGANNIGVLISGLTRVTRVTAFSNYI
jgi:hypothetical protein